MLSLGSISMGDLRYRGPLSLAIPPQWLLVMVWPLLRKKWRVLRGIVPYIWLHTGLLAWL